MQQDNTRPLILLGLNEVNFEYLEAYAAQGHLPNFKKLFEECGIVKTSSEKAYKELEPWIQWVSVQTGKPFSEHGIFRLGDVTDAGITQIWEHLEEKYGTKTAAISPMNAANRVKDPAFFLPDPWTKTEAKGDWLMQKLAEAVSNAVNENATGGSKLSSYVYILLGALRYSLFRRHIGLAVQILKSLRTHYQRAILLDQLLSDVFIDAWKSQKPGFSTLFLNGVAHLQHHYLFNSGVYKGANKNPDWYMKEDIDPVLDGCKSYDDIIGAFMKLPGNPRILIATGLHQTPVESPVFYWRLKHHGEFLNQIGIEHSNVQPRMSRDFLIEFADKAQADKAEKILASCTDQNGLRVFEEIENRENSIFASLTYPHDIKEGFVVQHAGGEVKNFNDLVGFVAIKNGEHDGEGYLVDSDAALPKNKAFPITDIFGLIDRHFADSAQAAQKKAA